MISKLMWMALGAYVYSNYLSPKYQAALQDRNALLSMLTPEQRASLVSGLQTAQNVASQAMTSVQQNLQATPTATQPVLALPPATGA